MIVGAGPAGIATGAGLERRGLDSVVLERGDSIAPAWRRHYDRLHLHTHKQISGLPGWEMPADYPKYPSRDQVAEYLEAYAVHEKVKVRLRTEVATVGKTGDRWAVHTNSGYSIEADNVVMATGLSEMPRMPRYPKQEIYQGTILHSADYRNPGQLRDGPVLNGRTN